MVAVTLNCWLIGLVAAVIVSQPVAAQWHHEEDHHSHHHKRPTYNKDGKFHDGVVFDKEHIYEDIKETYNMDMGKDDISEDQLAFLYFQTHDFDKNGKLDGLELLRAMNHIFDEPEEGTTTTPKPDPENDGPIEEFYRLRAQRKWNDKYIKDSEFIDAMLEQFDIDKDGYLGYVEYAMAARTQ